MKFAERANGIATGHILALSTIKPASTYTYYFGNAWDHNEELGIRSLTDWEATLSKQAQLVKSPLKVTIK